MAPRIGVQIEKSRVTWAGSPACLPERAAPQIDTEGAEALVLGGSPELLASGRVRNLVVEITSAHWCAVPLPPS